MIVNAPVIIYMDENEAVSLYEEIVGAAKDNDTGPTNWYEANPNLMRLGIELRASVVFMVEESPT